MIHSSLERVSYCSMKIGLILNFEEWTRIANSSSTNLRKAEFFISICSNVMSQILTVFERVFVKFTLSRIFFKLSLLIFSIPEFDAKLNSASNGDSFKGNLWQKYGSLGRNTVLYPFLLAYLVGIIPPYSHLHPPNLLRYTHNQILYHMVLVPMGSCQRNVRVSIKILCF